jgi:2-oxoglutarate/2-oxoacid ferredoxin oxidoreductase subunit beta
MNNNDDKEKKKFSYCAGCGHIIVTKAVNEVLMKYHGTVVTCVGCSAGLPDFVDCNALAVAHGRGLPPATGIILMNEDEKVIVYSGDGDSMSIGIEHLCHTSSRNTNLVQIIVNNSAFSMTGFQMSATTPLGVKTRTCLNGRDEKIHGKPINAEFVRMINQDVHFVRCVVTNTKEIKRFKDVIEKELLRKGFSVVEVFSPCPTLWGGDTKYSYKYTNEQYNRFNIICDYCKKDDIEHDELITILYRGDVLHFCGNECIKEFFGLRK